MRNNEVEYRGATREGRRHKVKMKCSLSLSPSRKKKVARFYELRHCRSRLLLPRPAKMRAMAALLLICPIVILCDIKAATIDYQPRFGNQQGGLASGELGTNSIEEDRFQVRNFGRPEFDLNQESRIVATRWQTEAFLPCRILNLDEEQTVSWIRKRDSLVLTIDKLRLIDDQRFQLAHSEQNWTLVIKQPSNEDAGLYECQVSSLEPKLARLVELRMVEAESRISNFSSLYVRPNEPINVTCTIEAPQRTDFVYWYKNKEPIQFVNLRAERRTRRRVRDGGLLYEEQPFTALSSKRSLLDHEGNEVDERQAETTARLSARTSSKAAKGQDEIQFVQSLSQFAIERAQANDSANYTCLAADGTDSFPSCHYIRPTRVALADGYNGASELEFCGHDRLLFEFAACYACSGPRSLVGGSSNYALRSSCWPAGPQPPPAQNERDNLTYRAEIRVGARQKGSSAPGRRAKWLVGTQMALVWLFILHLFVGAN